MAKKTMKKVSKVKKVVKAKAKKVVKIKKIVAKKVIKKAAVKSNVSKKKTSVKIKSTKKKAKVGAEKKELMILPDHELQSLPTFAENTQKDSQLSSNTNTQLNNQKELEVDFAALQKQFEGNAMPTMPAVEEKPKKKSFFAWLFGKKEEAQPKTDAPKLDEAPLKKDFDFASLQTNQPVNNSSSNASININEPILSEKDKKDLFEDVNLDKSNLLDSKKKVNSNTTEEGHFDLTPEKLEQMEVSPKKSIVSRLFSNKSNKTPVEKLPAEVKKGFSEDVSEDLVANETPERREEMYLEEMYKKMDDEIRERHSHLNEKENKISKKEEELKNKEENILKREFDYVVKEKEMDQIKKLKDEIENEKISLNYQKQKIEELKTELALKDAALREKEIALEKENKEISKLSKIKLQEDKELSELKTEVNEEDDAIEFLEQEIEKQRKEFEEKMKSLQMETIQTPDAITEIHNMINDCYQELGLKNYASVNKAYSQIRAKYIAEGKKLDPKGEVYNEIIKLYKDISDLTQK